jgi:RNA-directed DNA polymerase
VATFLANIREVVNANKGAKTADLIYLLNQKIVGWAMYHRHICAKATFEYVDHAIFETLWQWCKRRHPNKSRHWVADRYFTSIPGLEGKRHWVFYGTAKRAEGERRSVHLRLAASIRIRRHIKVKAAVNPYDPKWREYLQRRHSREEYRSKPAEGSGSNLALPKSLSNPLPSGTARTK